MFRYVKSVSACLNCLFWCLLIPPNYVDSLSSYRQAEREAKRTDCPGPGTAKGPDKSPPKNSLYTVFMLVSLRGPELVALGPILALRGPVQLFTHSVSLTKHSTIVSRLSV